MNFEKYKYTPAENIEQEKPKPGLLRDEVGPYVEELADDLITGKTCIIQTRLIEKKYLPRRWKISEPEIKEIVLHGGLRQALNINGNWLDSQLQRIQRNFDPYAENHVPLSQSQEQYLRMLFGSLYKNIYYFALREVIEKDSVWNKENKHILSKSGAGLAYPELAYMIRKAVPEIMRIYKPVKKVGFRTIDEPEKMKRAAIQEFNDHKKEFKILKQKDLSRLKLYFLTVGKERRDFVGAVIQTIIIRIENKKFDKTKLYKDAAKICPEHLPFTKKAHNLI